MATVLAEVVEVRGELLVYLPIAAHTNIAPTSTKGSVRASLPLQHLTACKQASKHGAVMAGDYNKVAPGKKLRLLFSVVSTPAHNFSVLELRRDWAPGDKFRVLCMP